MEMTYNFEQTRPYTDAEVPYAIHEILHDNFFPIVVNYLQPGADMEQIRHNLSEIRTIKEFQEKIMHKAIRAILTKSSTGLTFNGLEEIDNQHRHIFIANHRDIVLDAAILDVLLTEHNIDTCQITFGSNLMKGDLVINVGKLNKMFRIVRGGNIKDFYKNSLEVSAYMRHVIKDLHESVWIAQRNGRTKDGKDKTELGVLKMLSLSSNQSFVDNLDELSLTPISISYEYEPCDFLKTAELYISRLEKYIKGENEDLNSIITGIKQKKGKIHLSVCKPITREELELCNQKEKNEKFEMLGEIIDQRINQGRKIYNTNYIAYDLLTQSNQYAHHYSVEEKNNFIEYMKNGLTALELKADETELEKIFLSIYANCLR